MGKALSNYLNRRTVLLGIGSTPAVATPLVLAATNAKATEIDQERKLNKERIAALSNELIKVINEQAKAEDASSWIIVGGNSQTKGATFYDWNLRIAFFRIETLNNSVEDERRIAAYDLSETGILKAS